ncbi:MAG: serine--tRNA ligase, partial [Bacteroidales bacterium]
MLTLQVIKENPQEVIARLAKKHFDAEEVIAKVLDYDQKRRTAQLQLDNTLAEMNQLSKSIGALMKEGKRDEADANKAKVATLKEGVKEVEAEMKTAEEEMTTLLLTIPNLPCDAVPAGKLPEDNVVERTGGEMPNLGSDAVPHWDLCKKYDLIDFELGVKITGSGFPVYKGKGARL